MLFETYKISTKLLIHFSHTCNNNVLRFLQTDASFLPSVSLLVNLSSNKSFFPASMQGGVGPNKEGCTFLPKNLS